MTANVVHESPGKKSSQGTRGGSCSSDDQLSDLSDEDELLQLPLERKWALWTRIQAGAFDSKNFEDSQWQKIAKFDTVEKFQAIVQHVEKPSAIVLGVFSKTGANAELMGGGGVADKYVEAIAYFKDGCFPVATSASCRARWDCRLKDKEVHNNINFCVNKNNVK